MSDNADNNGGIWSDDICFLFLALFKYILLLSSQRIIWVIVFRFDIKIENYVNNCFCNII